MSYTAANLALMAGTLGSRTAGGRHWMLTGTDALTTVIGASYISDAIDKGMSVNDILTYIKTDTDDVYELAVVSVSATAATLDGRSTILGATTSTLLGFYGATAISQPTSADQAAVATTAITALVTTAATSNSPFGFTSAQANAILAAVNSLITQGAALVVQGNRNRTDLVALGLVKGS